MLKSVKNGNKIEMRILQGNIYKCLLVTFLLFLPVSGSAPKCCPGEAAWIPKLKNCTDGSRVQINCTDGFFKVNPEVDTNDRFHIEDNRNVSWMILENDDSLSSYNISPNQYCIGKLSEDKTNGQIALICFHEEIQNFTAWRFIFFGALSILSSFFLALTLFIYIILPEMRDVQDKAMMSMMASFLVAFFLNGSQQLKFIPFEKVSCLFIAFLMYYAYLAAFSWLNIISLNIWKSVWFPTFKIQSDVLFNIYSIIGWGLPLCFLAVSLITHHINGFHLRPGFGEINCWFNGRRATWIYFYGPILILLLLNLCYLGFTSLKLWYKFKEKSCKLRVLRFKCLMYIKLALVMGFTWIFEVLSFAFGSANYIYWILPDLLNVLQGLFIFILLVVLRKRVRKLLAKRRPFNIPFPKSWAAYSDQENYEPIGPEELELSQTS